MFHAAILNNVVTNELITELRETGQSNVKLLTEGKGIYERIVKVYFHT